MEGPELTSQQDGALECSYGRQMPGGAARGAAMCHVSGPTLESAEEWKIKLNDDCSSGSLCEIMGLKGSKQRTCPMVGAGAHGCGAGAINLPHQQQEDEAEQQVSAAPFLHILPPTGPPPVRHHPLCSLSRTAHLYQPAGRSTPRRRQTEASKPRPLTSGCVPVQQREQR